MDVFELRNHLTSEYGSYITSFIRIRDERINSHVRKNLDDGVLWPEPLIQLNPFFEAGTSLDALVDSGTLHTECKRIFRRDKDKAEYHGSGQPLHLHRHQSEAIQIAQTGANYVLTTGTGSGKSLAYIIPIVNHVLRRGSGRGVQAIVVYPMNALANSQEGELKKFLRLGYEDGKSPVTFARYTGQESPQRREEILAKPPDILLTNYVMLELMLTRPIEHRLINAAQGLRFLVLDELHTYRGRQGADVALLVRRTRDALAAEQLQVVGTSATLAGAGSYDQRRAEVAQVATHLFGAPVRAEHVIGETLRRATPAREFSDPAFVRELSARMADPAKPPPRDYEGFITDPLSIWLESTFGIAMEGNRLRRALPRSIRGTDGAAHMLSAQTGVDEEQCARAIQTGLMAGYTCQPDPETGFTPFAFKLHQFISRGDTVYASLEPEATRHITMQGQKLVPGRRDKALLPLAFCRECGQEYYSARAIKDDATGTKGFIPREVSDQSSHDGEAGFLHGSTSNPWPDALDAVLERVPDDWAEETRSGRRIQRERRRYVPQKINLGTNGQESDTGLDFVYFPAPFRFCLQCGVTYGMRQGDDFAKLASLASEGRSTATTILSLSAVRYLKADHTLPVEARKLLSFTDNRQDASLQAGHFNDFIEVGVLRAAVYRAISAAGSGGLHHDELPQKVFDALDLPLESYAVDPNVRFRMRDETQQALRNVLGYRLYRDLRRGWRITSPNLEQCGLLEIRYQSLDEVCQAEDLWEKAHPALIAATLAVRMQVARVLLDYMRREMALKVNFLDPRYQEMIKQQSSQRLIDPWAIDENETPEPARILFPIPKPRDERDKNVYLSARGGFGQFVRRELRTLGAPGRLRVEDTETIIANLLEALKAGGLVEVVDEREEGNVPGYQVPASALVWVAGDGTRAFHDPIRVPNLPPGGGRTNPFFVEFYRSTASGLRGLEAREHTAQVPSDLREMREQAFGKATLPILYCSPTMELGVDIKELNVVNLRNIPPTPANYAQRSGRAGRSGQPALVFAYCSTGSPHDQYFFRRPDLMVAGQVTPPRLDLANEDLVRAHVQAIWLAATGASLGQSLKDVLDVTGDAPSLALLPSLRANLDGEAPKRRARERAATVLTTIHEDLLVSDWYHEGWLDRVLDQAVQRFEAACDRWRGLFRAALAQAKAQTRIIHDVSRSFDDKQQATRLRREAEEQLKLLTEIENVVQSDFYSYRYFASEGFLPGYSFPRLPLSAYLPGRRTQQRDEFLSRPRFLAISEFGPRAIVYHEGSRYLINKVILPVEGNEPLTHLAKRCEACGYLHPIFSGEGPDRCERCLALLAPPMRQLFQLRNVSTVRREKINSDEEERMRLGYELITGVRFAEHGERPPYRTAEVEQDGAQLARLMYGQSATLWRINLGWSRRANREQYGFMLDLERGYWAKESAAAEGEDDPLSPKTARVIPYVEDTRNCLLFEPTEPLDKAVMASLQAALKSAIQVTYNLEDNELAAEPLPSADDRRMILFYESAEGGAGALRRLADDPQALAVVAGQALQLCHFDPETGADLHRAPHAREDCEAACYDCLMSYANQREHMLLDRQKILPVLLDLTHSSVAASPAAGTRGEHVQQLKAQTDSDLERTWLAYMDERKYRLPTRAQVFIEACQTRPDFLYDEERAAIYIDGPQHRYPERHARDVAQSVAMDDRGYTVIRFRPEDEWDRIIAQFPNIFGRTA
jgi:ATP-dependent helicase YprA (DUF1998 family)/very-short-patch-repair endonuclease